MIFTLYVQTQHIMINYAETHMSKDAKICEICTKNDNLSKIIQHGCPRSLYKAWLAAEFIVVPLD